MYLVYTIIRHDRLARFIPVKKLGLIERDLEGLKQVIVVANQPFQKPSDTLAEAVEDNFLEKVKYLFLVSKSTAENELHGYFLVFEALAKIAMSKSKNILSIRDLVEIKRLPYDWARFSPYIFYQFSKENSEELLTLAFKGNQRLGGIADYYEPLSIGHSQAIILALLAEAPESMRGSLRLVEPTDDFVQKVKAG